MNKIEWNKETIDKVIVYSSLLFIFPLMGVHLYFTFSTHIHMPFWFEWFSFVISGIITFACGYEFFKLAFKEMFVWKSLGMNSLVSISSLIAFSYSVYAIIANTIAFSNGKYSGHNFDFSHIAAMIVVIVKTGDLISDKLRKKSNYDIEQIASLQVKECNLYNEQTKESTLVNTKDIKINDLIQVKKGERIPVDGIIYNGETYIDESMITGESKPILKTLNSKVLCSTNNLANTVIIKTIATGKDMVVSNIIRNVKNIASKKPKYQKLVDKVSFYFTPIIIILAFITFLLHAFVPNMNEINGIFNNWFGIQTSEEYSKWSLAVFYAIGTLSIACPCALGIAAPAACLVGASKAAKNGIVINTSEAYEKIKKIDAICFDKTGTLTKGVFDVHEILGNKNNLNVIYEMEKQSIHPLAVSFVKYCKNLHLKTTKLENISEMVGIGLKANDSENNYELISLTWALKNNYEFDNDLNEFLNDFKGNKYDDLLQSYSCFVKNNKVENILIFSDSLNDNAIDTIKIFEQMKIKTYIISGDNQKSVEYIAKKLNIQNYFYNVNPSEKSKIIEDLQKQNLMVAYVGDGINDLEALKHSDLSIAISKNNSVAQNVSDILILNNDILTILKAIEITKTTRKMIIFNLIWAFAYNILVIPLSMIGFIPPFIGVFIMATSDITVVSNTLFFRLKKIRYIPKRIYKNVENKKICEFLK